MRILRTAYEKIKWLMHNTIMLVNIIFILLLLLSYLSSYASPREIWLLSFFGLAYPFLLLANLVFVIYWAAKKKLFFLYSLIMILAGWVHLTNTFQIRIKQNIPLNPENSFTFLSYNVRLFNLYNWIDEPSVKTDIFDFLVTEDPDVLCIQEYFYNADDPFNDTRLFQRLHDRYSHIEYSSSNNRNFNFGIATFSKYPIVRTGRIDFPNSTNISIYTDVAINADTVRIFNNHLQSIQFTQNDINFLDSLGRHNRERNMAGIRDITSKLRAAYVTRSRQVEIIVSHIRQAPYPVIITGDFNDTPVSYTYRQLRNQDLNDAFVKSGSGIGNTYVSGLPFFRIDYILYSRELNSFAFESPKIELSDHYPLKCEFHFMRSSD